MSTIKLNQLTSEDRMVKEAISKETVLKRLKMVEGQIRGIQKMIENGRDCEAVITQLASVRAAMEGVAGLILKNYMKFCFADEMTPDRANVESLARSVAIWGGVHAEE